MATPAERLLSREARLLMLTAAGPARDPDIASLAEEGIDWPRLTRIAESERAEPVLVRRLRSVLGRPLPTEAARLEQLARVADFRQAWIEERLQASLAALASAGIDAVLLKGAALAITHYRAFLERPMVDLDVLVDPGRATEAHERLRGAGWAWQHDPQLDGFYATHHHLAPLHDPRGVGVGLDLHREPVCAGSPFGLTGELLRSRAVPAEFRGHTVLVPEVHDQLLHLCMHFGWSHLLSGGSWRTFRDLNRVVAGGVEWPLLVERAREHHASACCYWVLRIARTVTGLAVPDHVLSSLVPSLPATVRTAIERHYVLHMLPSESLATSVVLNTWVWELGMQPGRQGHGPARPWDRTAVYKPSTGLPERSARRGIGARFRRLRTLGAYTRAMLGAR